MRPVARFEALLRLRNRRPHTRNIRFVPVTETMFSPSWPLPGPSPINHGVHPMPRKIFVRVQVTRWLTIPWNPASDVGFTPSDGHEGIVRCRKCGAFCDRRGLEYTCDGCGFHGTLSC